jgi:ankyrin repeat protein
MEIHSVCQEGRCEAVAAWLDRGGEIDSRDPLERTLLHVACEFGHAPLVELLIRRGADPHARDYRNNTPLQFASGMGLAVAVRALLDVGANATDVNVFETTPLHALAAGGGKAPAADRLEVVERLLAAGAVLDARDSSDRTPLWFAASTGTAPRPPDVMAARLAVLAHLLSLGADPKLQARGEQGTPLHAARGLHQSKRYRIAWPEAIALLEPVS